MALDELAYYFYLSTIESLKGMEIKKVHKSPGYNVGFGVRNRTSPFLLMQGEFNENSQEDLDFTKVEHFLIKKGKYLKRHKN